MGTKIEMQFTPAVNKLMKAYMKKKEKILLEQLSFCESPIEEQLFISLQLLKEHPPVHYHLELLPQHSVELSGKEIRIDFLLTVTYKEKVFEFAIECDGHDYHERTKEQAANDKSRDRLMLQHSMIPVHFTGSEIHHWIDKCSKDLIGIIDEMTGRNEDVRKEEEPLPF